MNEEIKVIKDRIADLEAQLAALEADERQGLNYVPWYGGECPVYEQAIVRVEMRDGSTREAMAADLWWDHEGCKYDIEAYAVISDPSLEGGWPNRGDIYYAGGEKRIWNDTWLDSYLYGEGLVVATKEQYWDGGDDD